MNTVGRGVLTALSCFCAAQAEDCKLISYGTVPLTHIEGHSSEFVPVEIAGVSKLMLLDTGASITTMTSKTVAELKLDPTRSADIASYDVTGAKSDQFVTASLKIGSLRGDKVTFMLGTSYLDDFGDPRAAGLLGADIFRKFDISIDYGAHTFAMLNQDHCDGQVVYWPERPLAVIPFRLVNGADIILSVTLDGHELDALLDTGAYRSTLEKSRAEGRYGLILGSADTPVKGTMSETDKSPYWSHRFKTLSLAGLEVNNPEIDIIPDKISAKINTWSTGSLLDQEAHGIKQPPMLLGMNVLKHLHLYIAYKEKKLYITPAASPTPQTGAAR